MVGGKLIQPSARYSIKAGHALLLILARSSLKILNVLNVLNVNTAAVLPSMDCYFFSNGF